MTNCGIGIGRIIESMATKKKKPSQIFFFSQVALFTATAVTFVHAVWLLVEGMGHDMGPGIEAVITPAVCAFMGLEAL